MWTDDLFGNQKPVIGMVHIQALPGTVLYDGKAGLESVLANARQDYESLAEGGISGVIFCNEFDKPYSMGAESHIVASMTHIIDEVRRGAKDIPFGVDIQWDPKAALAVARATGASFIRGMCEAGYADNIMLGGDNGRASMWPQYGGGYGHDYIPDIFVPRMQEAGISQECIDKMLIDNPRRQFSIVK